MSMHRSISAALVLATLMFSSAALAQQDEEGPSHVLRVGKLYSFGGGTNLDHGFGLDLRYQFLPDADLDGYFGVYAQGQYELGDAWRFNGGLTGGWGMFGLDVGVSHRTATSEYVGSTGLSIAQHITFGPISVGGRLTIPLYDHMQGNVVDAPTLVQGIEGAVTVTLGWGFTLSGPSHNEGCHGHGGHHGHRGHGE
jgi:hypothetical protein